MLRAIETALVLGVMTASVHAQSLLTLEVSKAGKEDWHGTIESGPGDSIDVRVVVSYVGDEKPLGLASVTFQPTLSNWIKGEDKLMHLVNSGWGGQESVPIGAVKDEPGRYGRIVPFATAPLDDTQRLMEYVTSIGGTTYLRVARMRSLRGGDPTVKDGINAMQ